MSQLRSRIYKDGVLVNGGGGGAGSDTTAIHDDTANEINAITAKATPVAADVAIIEDSADSWNKKKIALTSLLGGGGGASPFDATVAPSGADYTTVFGAGGAIAAGKRNMMIAGNVTETAGLTTTTTDDINIYIPPNNDWDTASYALDFSASGGPKIYIDLHGSWTRSGATNTFLGNSTPSTPTGELHIVGTGTIYDSSTSNRIARVAVEKMSGFRYEAPNRSECGFNSQGVYSYSNLTIIGGGSSCARVFRPSSTLTNGSMSNLTLQGTFSTASEVFRIQTEATLESIINDTAQNVIFLINSGSNVELSKLTCEGAASWDLWVSGVDHSVSQCNLNGGDFDPMTSVRCVFTAIKEIATIDLTDVSMANCKFYGCRATNAATMNGDRNRLTDNDFLGGLQDNGDDNGHNNNQYGPDGGGGALTLTLGAAAVRPRVDSCMTDAAIIDLGSTTPAISPNTNTVY
jgi:hypothetical protein